VRDCSATSFSDEFNEIADFSVSPLPSYCNDDFQDFYVSDLKLEVPSLGFQ
jgi:hypothetical protein